MCIADSLAGVAGAPCYSYKVVLLLISKTIKLFYADIALFH